MDKKSVASGTTASSEVKKRTIGSAMKRLDKIMPHTNKKTAPIRNAM